MKKPPVRPAPAQREAALILNAIRRLVRGLRVYTRECEARLGLSAAQLFALGHVRDRDGLSLQELADATLTDLSSVSVVAKRLEAKGLLQRRRAKDDARRSELRLTPSGAALLRRAPDALQDRLVKSLLAMPAGRRRALGASLAGLLKGAGLEQHPVEMFFEERP